MVIIIVGIQNATILVNIPTPNPSDNQPLPINRLRIIDIIQHSDSDKITFFFYK